MRFDSGHCQSIKGWGAPDFLEACNTTATLKLQYQKLVNNISQFLHELRCCLFLEKQGIPFQLQVWHPRKFSSNLHGTSMKLMLSRTCLWFVSSKRHASRIAQLLLAIMLIDDNWQFIIVSRSWKILECRWQAISGNGPVLMPYDWYDS